MTDARQQALIRMTHGAQRYAEADRSDPFALHRAYSHIRNGVASVESYYDAEEYTEMRTIIGSSGEAQTFPVKAFKNVRRP